MKRAWAGVMAGDMAGRPARREIDASGDTDHAHLHLLMTLYFWHLSPCHLSECKLQSAFLVWINRCSYALMG